MSEEEREPEYFEGLKMSMTECQLRLSPTLLSGRLYCSCTVLYPPRTQHKHITNVHSVILPLLTSVRSIQPSATSGELFLAF